METGSTSKEAPKKLESTQKGDSKSESIESLVPRDHSPSELRSWAKRTGFVSNFSGEVAAPPPPPPPPPPPTGSTSERRYAAAPMLDLEKGFDPKDGTPSPTIEIDPILGRARRRGPEIDEFESKNDGGDALGGLKEGSVGEAAFCKDGQRKVGFSGIANANRREDPRVAPAAEPPKKDDASMESEDGITIYPHGQDPVPGKSSAWKLKCGLTDNPGIGLLMYYGLQHYLSLVGSLILIPLITVPAMGGTDKDTATVISTMLLVTGITTILHSFFGTRLPLVQGSSFVFMAPALVIMNSRDYRNLTEHKFRHIMRELQGGIIVGSIFQSILGFSGFMSLLVRLINPVVVAPTVAAVGLAFFSYGFPQAGSCVEISIPQIFLLLLFSLYLRGISIFGVKLFRIYAVPLSVLIIWAYAFSLTAGGAYDFKGCNPNIPASNILSEACRKHVYTMRHCRTDVSNAWKTAYWVRIPYPFQWGMPIFRVRTSIIMMFVSVIASMDSVGTYYTASLHSNLKPPTRGIVSRGIGLEGVCSTFAGLWGSATGSTTLTENVHTINITKVSSRRAIELGALFLILASFIGKVGAILASIPEALAASVLCFTWALIVALGLSNLQYSQTASFRNVIIVGVSLFLGLSIPAYFQQYQPLTRLMLPSYFLPFSAASDGPVHTGSDQIDFAINALFSMNMVVTLLVAVVLDNTVPGKQEERGVYRWSTPEDMAADPSLLAKYSPPRRFAWFCRWPRCLGA